MVRFTFYNELGEACFRLGTMVFASNIFAKKLAAYEDTGLTPDEVVALKAERDALFNELHPF